MLGEAFCQWGDLRRPASGTAAGGARVAEAGLVPVVGHGRLLRCAVMTISVGLGTTFRFGALASVLAVSGCGLCGDVVCGGCPPALTLKVSDSAEGGPISELSITGATADCVPRTDLGYTLCQIQLDVGNYELDLQAPGYAPQTISVTINPDSGESCCSCGYNAKTRDVALTPA